MLRFWIILLRAAGTVLFLVGVVGGLIRMVGFIPLYRFSDAWFNDFLPILERAALALLIFAAASALSTLRQMEARQLRAASARRAARASANKTVENDLAPVAPNWDELKFGVHPAAVEKSLARSRRMGTDDLGKLFEREFEQWRKERLNNAQK